VTKHGVIEVRFEVLAAMGMTGILFRYVMPFSLLQVSVVAEEPDGGGTVT